MNKHKMKNLLPEPMDGQTAFDQICDYILGKDWCVVDPLSKDQINTIAVEEIKAKWDKVTNRKLRDKWNKMIDQLKL